MYLMWKTTGNPIWRERAWEIFQAIEKHAKVNGASYATVLHVDQPVAMHADDQPRSVLCMICIVLVLNFTIATSSLRPSSIYISLLLKMILGHWTNLSSTQRHIHSGYLIGLFLKGRGLA